MQYCYTNCSQPCSRPPLTHPLLETPGHSQASLGQSLLGSLLLFPGSWYIQGSVCALQESISQSRVRSGSSMVGLMATSKRAYVIPKSAAPSALLPVAVCCWPIPPEEMLKHSSVSVSVGSLRPGVHKVCLSPLSVYTVFSWIVKKFWIYSFILLNVLILAWNLNRFYLNIIDFNSHAKRVAHPIIQNCGSPLFPFLHSTMVLSKLELSFFASHTWSFLVWNPSLLLFTLNLLTMKPSKHICESNVFCPWNFLEHCLSLRFWNVYIPNNPHLIFF